MAIFSELDSRTAALRGTFGGDVERTAMPSRIAALRDDELLQIVAEASAGMRILGAIRMAAVGVVAARSRREHGHDGLAQMRGHRSPVSLVQELTGTTRGDAAKQIRVGESLIAGLVPAVGGDAATGDRPDGIDRDGDPVKLDREPWHAPLNRALLAGSLTGEQHDAILRGLGEPPVALDAASEVSAPDTTDGGADATDGGADATDADDGTRRSAAGDAVLAWSVAAEQLIDEAQERTVEELLRTARSIRDRLDPRGAEDRFQARYEARAFRMSVAEDGTHRAFISFDDEAAVWARCIIDTALRPRRGGPRFVDAEEKEHDEQLAADSRTNDQLTYDLMMDVLRAGALADARAVFGTKQAGIRLVTVVDPGSPSASEPHVGHVEDDGATLPGWLIAQRACDTGVTECTIDTQGNPLYLGREHRLFSPAQRIALAIRDGGCRWRGCDRPASYCESHHIDHFVAHEGRTDIDRGILLCRFHHLQLHHGGWRITRDGNDDFVLHSPAVRGGDTIALEPRLALRYAWGDIAPPPKRFRVDAA